MPSNKKFVTDKAMTFCNSSFRTYSMFGLQRRLSDNPFHLNWNYDEVSMHKDMLERMHVASNIPDVKYTIVKCLVTITDREIGENEYHWSDHIKDDDPRKGRL